MIEIDIPSIDPMQHEPKIFLGMTSRQCLCIAPGLLAGIGLFMVLKDSSMDLAIISLMVTIVPAVCLGWYKPYNMRFEKFIQLWWFNTFIASPKRIPKNEEAEAPKPTVGLKSQKKQPQNKKKNNKKSANKNPINENPTDEKEAL